MAGGAEDSSTPPGPGAALRAARERKGLAVHDAARGLRLGVRVIEALEADDFAALPAPIFVKGYLNAYCRLLGLDVAESVAAYERAVGNIAPPPLVVSHGTGDGVGSKPSSRPLLVVVGLLIAAVLVALVGAALWPRFFPPAAPPEAAAPTYAEAPVGEPALAEAVEEDDSGTVGATLWSRQEAESEEEAAPAPIPGNIRARFEFAEDSWVEVVDAEGRRLFFDLARAGRVVEVEGRAPFDVFLGNAPGVGIVVDGHPFDHGPYNRIGNVARFSLGADTTGNRP